MHASAEALADCTPAKPGTHRVSSVPNLMSTSSKSETLGGVVMLGAAVVALIWVNSAARESYHALFSSVFGFSVGGLELRKSFELWISDALMAVFFLHVG